MHSLSSFCFFSITTFASVTMTMNVDPKGGRHTTTPPPSPKSKQTWCEKKISDLENKLKGEKKVSVNDVQLTRPYMKKEAKKA